MSTIVYRCDRTLHSYNIEYLQVVVLRDVGGLSLEEFTRRVMRSLMTTVVAKLYNIHGSNGKQAFMDSCLFNLFYSK